MYINVECRYSVRPSTNFPQNASTVQLGVSQPICGAAVMCRPAHGCPVLTFVPSANNCPSEHIHATVRSGCRNKQLQKENIWSDFGEGLYAKCLPFFLLLNLKYLQILKCVSFVNIYNLCSRVTFWDKRKLRIGQKPSVCY
jgi:hypothetical protein